jgi:hypothetical protein
VTDTMTEQPAASPRPPDSPALQRAEQALHDVERVADADPAEQAPLLAEAQSALAALLAEQPATAATGAPDDDESAQRAGSRSDPH